jgi:hypothetical protein
MMTSEHEPSVANTSDGKTPRHEASDIDIRGVFAFGAGLVAAAIIISVAIWTLFIYFERREASAVSAYPLAAGTHDALPPIPRLQAAPREDLEEFREREAEVLGGYSWIDRDTGVVRIPIEEAMRLVLERGLPVYEPPEDIEPTGMNEVAQEP